MTRVGTVFVDQFLIVWYPVSGIAACRAGRVREADRLPPPPIECPMTPSRLASMRVRTELVRVR
jgi:hypothetical protein